MRGATAALAGALLFFLGVLTAATDRDRVPPPAAIPLGVQPAPSEVVGRLRPAAGATPPAPVLSPPTPAAGDSSGPGGTTPGPSSPSSVPPAGEEPPGGGGSGGVEEVTGQVDCFDAGTGPSGACPPGQAKKVGEPPPEEKGGGDGKR